jgi:tripeptidyl-peptidase-1
VESCTHDLIALLESNLDFEYGMGLTFPLKTTLYQVGDAQISGSFNTLCVLLPYLIVVYVYQPLILLRSSLDALDSSYCSGDNPVYDPHYPDNQPGGYNGPKTCGKFKATKVISTSYAYVRGLPIRLDTQLSIMIFNDELE